MYTTAVPMTRAGPYSSEDDADHSDGSVHENDIVYHDEVYFSEDDDDLDEGEEDGEDEVRYGDVHETLDLLCE